MPPSLSKALEVPFEAFNSDAVHALGSTIASWGHRLTGWYIFIISNETFPGSITTPCFRDLEVTMEYVNAGPFTGGDNRELFWGPTAPGASWRGPSTEKIFFQFQ